jgi:hypothetical protein
MNAFEIPDPQLVFLLKPKTESFALRDKTGFVRTIAVGTDKLWLVFALRFTLADGSKYYVRWKRNPKTTCEACGQVIK